MTPYDATKLTNLKAALRRVIETKATDAPWIYDGTSLSIPPFRLMLRKDVGINPEDAAFIALSRQLLPAAAHGLIVAIDFLEEQDAELLRMYPGTESKAGDRLHSILAAFPDEI